MENIYLIPLLPLGSFIVNIIFGRRIKKFSAIVSIVTMLASCAISLTAFLKIAKGDTISLSIGWINIGHNIIKFGFYVDALTSVMLLVVTVIGSLILIYSVGYMQKDARFSRFFSYISLFCASMLGLVLSDNLALVYIFWELVGLCSYLLISFWFERPSAAMAGKKAFITTRIGDTGLLIGIFLLFHTTGSFSFSPQASSPSSQHLFTLAGILIFCGAVGKSAQFPLHIWLPDAMEGPTPVSALIHAATMVAAGVYLVARSFPIFSMSHQALCVVAYTGTITAFFAATIAAVATDIKKVLAYSTISQLGFMMLALGVGGYTAGMFHLTTHAAFKALLFLGAGSVIHSTHIQDITKMGGLLSKMKLTAITFIIAGFAISGIPPFSGFFSKDEILINVWGSGYRGIFLISLLTSALTAFYIARLIFLTFFGKERSNIHAHESPPVMTIPLIILALFSAGLGFLSKQFEGFLHYEGLHDSHHAHTEGSIIMLVSVFAALTAILLAWLKYIRNYKILPEMASLRLKPLYTLVCNKYYIDELYNAIIIRPFMAASSKAAGFDNRVIDGAVNRTAYLTKRLSDLKNLFDQYVIDGLVNGVAGIVQISSGALRRLQNGLVQNYILIFVSSAVVIVIFLFF